MGLVGSPQEAPPRKGRQSEYRITKYIAAKLSPQDTAIVPPACLRHAGHREVEEREEDHLFEAIKQADEEVAQ